MLRMKSPAKINLSLAVLGRKGHYHQVEMVMTTLDLSDYVTLSISEAAHRKINIKSTNILLPTNKDNIAFKAADVFLNHFKLDLEVNINIEKNIPVAAGLAGGSSNAAAVLKGLRKLTNVDCSLDLLCKLGAKVGSDVPFCIVGQTALATGRGEVITPIKSMVPCWAIVVNPRLSISTSDVYSAFRLQNVNPIETNNMLNAIENQNFSEICNQLENHLESVTIKKVPQIVTIKEALITAGANGVLMSGSGPTVFALIYTEKKAIAIYNHIKSIFPSYLVHLTRVLT